MANTIESQIHVSDCGTALTVIVSDSGVILDLSSATLMEIHIGKPDGTILIKPAALSTDGTDGKMEYVTTDNDLSIPGMYKIQGYVEFGSNNWSTEINKFRVYPNL